ncbi:hypothetical protein Fmac_024743 [Flemingia macrophylla]|uniref:Uncharacterized protein n=1 Tax=Flemingia macrophylla TaxID=520843 RepID=A0ABD1LS01_9FABA
MENSKQRKKNYRKRSVPADKDQLPQSQTNNDSDDERERRMALEEIKLLQKQGERKLGILANPSFQAPAGTTAGVAAKPADKNDGDGGDKDELVVQDTFAQEAAVMVEDPNMVKYIELELAKKRALVRDTNDVFYSEKVKFGRKFYSVDYWYCEVQLPIEYKLKNIKETEAAKKLLQEKRLMGRTKSDFNIPASYSADYFQRGRDYAEKKIQSFTNRNLQDDSSGSKQNDSSSDAPGAVQRQAATDENSC